MIFLWLILLGTLTINFWQRLQVLANKNMAEFTAIPVGCKVVAGVRYFKTTFADEVDFYLNMHLFD